VKPISPELLSSARTGSDAARQAVCDALEPMVQSIVSRVKYNANCIDNDDLLQVGRLAILEAIQNFRPEEPDRGKLFTTYAYSYIWGYINNYIKNCGFTIRKPRYRVADPDIPVLSYDNEVRLSPNGEVTRFIEVLASGDVRPDDVAVARISYHDWLSVLDDTEKYVVLTLMHGVKTQKQLAEEMETTPHYVSMIKAAAYEKLRAASGLL
jgi:RNA polymerase sigma factor (sigma-70 family)